MFLLKHENLRYNIFKEFNQENMKESKNKLHIKVKGERREVKREKERFAPTGGSLGAQQKRSQMNREYQGLPKALKPKINIKNKTRFDSNRGEKGRDK